MKDLSVTKIIVGLLFLASFAFVSGCKDDEDEPSKPVEPETTIAVVTDVHSYDLALGHAPGDWDVYLAQDRKLLDENEAILSSFVDEMKNNSTIKIVLIAGDLTKDGEAASHSKLVTSLREIEKSGKKVYVVPGNHDISNPFSYNYLVAKAAKTANISPEQFATIYEEFGYTEAISRDPNSLSYVAEPMPGLWIIAMDAAKYSQNTASKIFHDGKFKPETLAWIKQKLTEAKDKGKKVIGMMHHGLVEHFTGQKTLSVSAEYVIDDWTTVAPELANLGLGLVFTGHFHANDVTAYASGSNTLYDVETASLIGYPSSYRLVTLGKGGAVNVATKLINSINYSIPDGLTFQLYAEREIKEGMIGLATYILQSPPFNLPEEQAQYLAPFVGDAFIRHYRGDETIPTETQALITDLMKNPASQPLGLALQSMLTDLPPGDNTATFTIPVNTK